MNNWTTEKIDNLRGKKVIITGASSGIGFEAAKVLASKGAEVILAVRNTMKGEKAAKKIMLAASSANLKVMQLDLSDLSSVRQFAEKFIGSNDRLDILINNAGVMVPPYRMTTDGFELQFGTNHLGHFALTARLLPLLLATPHSRVVTVSSIGARTGVMDFNNIDGSRGYNRMTFYRRSKLANLLFAIELQHRLEAAGAGTISIACHPGISATNLVSRGSGKETGFFIRFLMKLLVQPAEKGALPTLYAATDPDLKGGEFIGPDGPGNRRGNPVLTDDATKLFNQDVASRLWEVSEKLTAVKFPL